MTRIWLQLLCIVVVVAKVVSASYAATFQFLAVFSFNSVALFFAITKLHLSSADGAPQASTSFRFDFVASVLARCHGLMGAVGDGTVNVRHISFQFRCIGICSSENPVGVIRGRVPTLRLISFRFRCIVVGQMARSYALRRRRH